MPNDPRETPRTTQEKEALDRVHKVRSELEKARADHVQAVFDYAWEAGWSAGYDSGWQAAFEHLKRQEAELRAGAGSVRPRAPAAPPQLPLLQMTVPASKTLTATEIVWNYIKDHPGMRGVDIAKHFGSMSPPILERTIRTALHRGKMSERLRSIDGKWFHVESPSNEETP